MMNPIDQTPYTVTPLEHDEINHRPGDAGPGTLTCIDYSPGQIVIQEINDLENFVNSHRPDWSVVRWINVIGLSDMDIIHALVNKYQLHPLAVEDILNLSQRPKVEPYSGEDSEFQARLFIVAQALHLKSDGLHNEQISIFLGHRTVLSFEEPPNDMWEPIRQRLKSRGSSLRNNDASFLMYAMLDTIVDGCFPILEQFGDRGEELEALILENSQSSTLNQIHQLKRDLLLMHRSLWPMREVISNLQRDPHECMSETTRVYLRDLYDHAIQLIDIIEIYREMATDLTETYMSSVSNRMNEIMKVLTIISTVFIPLTFLAGVYGMNFHYLPELGQKWGYPAFWFICIALASIMVALFRRRKWI